MRRESLEYPEGVIDVGIIVVSLFDNPLKARAVEFLADVMRQRRRIAVPVSAVIGAYHIATSYLKLPRIDVRRILAGMLSTRSPALYPQITPDAAIDALEYSAYYGVNLGTATS